MTAVTISANRGTDYGKSVSYTIDTQAPVATFDMEVRYNTVDLQSVALKKLDLIRFLQAVIYGLESGVTGPGGGIGKSFFYTSVAGTNFVAPQI